MTASAIPANSHVLLAIVEIAPEDPSPGGQFLVLRNTGRAPVRLSCWSVLGQDPGLRLRVSDVTLAPGALVRLSSMQTIFRSPEQLVLRDTAHKLIDQSPRLVDNSADDRVWIHEAGAWRFGRTTYDGPVSDGQLSDRRDCAG